MNKKERNRMIIMENVITESLTLKQAAKLMGTSYRQAKRIKKGYKAEGEKFLIHKSRGKQSNHSILKSYKDEILKHYKEQYSDFGPTLASEELLERNNLKVNPETLRLWLIAAGYWTRKRRSSKHRQRRDRKPCFGEMLQFDGSSHDWFEGRGPKCCLMNMIDDATNTNSFLFFDEETTEAAMIVLWNWIIKYGIPQSLYCDKKNAYLIFREPTLKEQLKGITHPKTHFGKACEKLGIRIIPAHSAPAKGRIERSNGVHQDRLIKKMRLENICNMEEANKFIKSKYIWQHNLKFAIKPKDRTDLHTPLKKSEDLRNVFCYEYERVVTNDYIVQFETREFQIIKDNKELPRPKATVILRKWLDGTIHLFYKDKELKIKEKNLVELSNASSL